MRFCGRGLIGLCNSIGTCTNAERRCGKTRMAQEVSAGPVWSFGALTVHKTKLREAK